MKTSILKDHYETPRCVVFEMKQMLMDFASTEQGKIGEGEGDLTDPARKTNNRQWDDE